MKSQNPNNIFSDQGCLSKDMLMKYSSGDLTSVERHEVEKHLVECPLCTEAVEGFVIYDGKLSFNDVESGVLNIASQGKTGFRKYYAAAAALGTIVLLSYVVISLMKDVPENRMAIKENAEENPAPLVVREKEAQHALYDSNEVNAAAAETQQANADDVKLKYERPAEGINTGNNAEPERLQEMTAEEVAPVSAPSLEKDDITHVKETAANAVTYVDNLKVVDQSDNLSLQQAEAVSVKSSAKNEQKKSNSDSEVFATQSAGSEDVTYNDKLADGLALFNKGRYQSAIFIFDELLASNPGNANAQFYKGVSHFHLKNYEAAIRLLEPFNKDSRHAFHEEAEYYIATALARKGDIERGSFMLNNIISNKGFNHRQASEELKNLKQ